ncbi:MAG: PIN domain-containing protein [Candidatus Altiarchaeota archaeon]|nr:PIN domain-containing protein [Candidatus Altiarchaeota archaeon]
MIELKNYLRTSFDKAVLFDTDVVIDFLKGDKRSTTFFDTYVFSGLLTPTISSFTAAELFSVARDKREEQNLDLWLSSAFDILEMDYQTLKEAGILKKTHKMQMSNAIIAAVATKERIPLLTSNSEQYRKLNMRIFKPYV